MKQPKKLTYNLKRKLSDMRYKDINAWALKSENATSWVIINKVTLEERLINK